MKIPESTVYDNIKKILVKLASKNKLPLDMNDFDPKVLAPAIKPLLKQFGHVIADNEGYVQAAEEFNSEMFCEDNFNATIWACEQALNHTIK